jgi:hypothetical protein
MRTVLLFVPALICAGSMLVCVRMMTRGHRDEGSPAARDEEHIP